VSVIVHPTALVDPRAELGEGVRIGPYCVLDGRIRIGDGTVLEAFVRICDFVELGRDCRLSEQVVLGREPQDTAFAGEESWVRIGNRVILRENVTIHRASGEGKATEVGDDCWLMEGCHLGHNVRMGRGCIMANKAGCAGHVQVGDHVNFGGMAGVHQFVKIGRFAMLGGLSKIVKDVPPFTLIDGRPARVYGLNKVGLRRNGFDLAARLRIRALYERIYRSGLPVREAVTQLEAEAQDEYGLEIVAFAKASRRGLMPWISGGRTGREVE
jgi:UDP-N-acetylglucosamine acyltransferase